MTIGPTGCRRNSNSVTTPKLPPPPRRPQNRSGFSSALARTTLPSAVTTSAESRLSHVTPYIRSSQPLPLPSARPPTPVSDTRPPVTARPCSCVAASMWPQVRRPDPRRARPRGRPRRVHRAEVDHDPVVAGAVAGRRVGCRRARRRARSCSRPKLTAATTSSVGRAADDQGRMAVDHPVPDAARLLVVRMSSGVTTCTAHRAS